MSFGTINRISPKGRGLTKDEKVEVIGALPGEEVEFIRIGSQKGRKIALLDQVINASPDRISPPCSHVPSCGGCSLQQLDYAAQLVHKQNVVEQLFSSLEVRPIIGCVEPFRYRNKMEFSFSQDGKGNRYLGLMLAGCRGKVHNVSQCYLVSPWFSKTLEAVRKWWSGTQLLAYRHARDTGHLRTLTLRESIQGVGKMVMLTVSGRADYAMKKKEMESFIQAILEVSSEDISIFIQVQQLAAGRPTQFFEMLLHGPDHITERLHVLGHTLDFKISPTSFFQPNTLGAQRLYAEALSLISLQGTTVFDLYCGGATIGLTAAKCGAKSVLGIEQNPHSVFDAGWNQEVNNVENFSIYQGDVGEVLGTLKGQSPDVVIVDPPRAGLDDKALSHIAALSPKELLYISCNPKTQAKNIIDLEARGYTPLVIQPVDQFPHTVHIENIVLLKRLPSTEKSGILSGS